MVLRRQAGFTLIETLFVFLILGLLGSMTMPAISKVFTGKQLEAVAWRMAQDIRLVQQESLEQSANLRIRFLPRMEGVPQSNAYWLFLKPSQPMLYQAVNMPEGITMLGQTFDPNHLSYDLTFSTQGVPSRGGTAYLQAQGGIRYNVVVTPVTARVRVERQ